MFFLTLLLALAMSLLVATMRDQWRQKAAAEAIERAGGHVYAERTWLGALLRDDSLVSVKNVGFSGTSVADATLVHLDGLKHLRGLVLQREGD